MRIWNDPSKRAWTDPDKRGYNMLKLTLKPLLKVKCSSYSIFHLLWGADKDGHEASKKIRLNITIKGILDWTSPLLSGLSVIYINGMHNATLLPSQEKNKQIKNQKQNPQNPTYTANHILLFAQAPFWGCQYTERIYKIINEIHQTNKKGVFFFYVLFYFISQQEESLGACNSAICLLSQKHTKHIWYAGGGKKISLTSLLLIHVWEVMQFSCICTWTANKSEETRCLCPLGIQSSLTII